MSHMTVLGTVLMSLQFAPIFLNTEIWSTGISKKKVVFIHWQKKAITP